MLSSCTLPLCCVCRLLRTPRAAGAVIRRPQPQLQQVAGGC
jgi:hypothetical protein